jgi:hypothetical protein
MLEQMLAKDLTAHDRARALAILALYRVARGDDGPAAVEAARLASAIVDENQIAASVAWAEALMALLGASYTEAIAAADRGVALWRNFELGLWPIAARAAVSGARREDFDRLKSLIETTPSTSDLTHAHMKWVSAMAAAVDGHSDAARQFSEAADQFAGLGFRTEEAWALLDAVTLLPDDPAAGDWATRARVTFERLKARPFLDLLDKAERVKAGPSATRSKVESIEVASEPA